MTKSARVLCLDAVRAMPHADRLYFLERLVAAMSREDRAYLLALLEAALEKDASRCSNRHRFGYRCELTAGHLAQGVPCQGDAWQYLLTGVEEG